MNAPSMDRFARIRLMLGEEKLARLQNSRVVVVGLGAVGSYAVEALARAGVGALRLVDFDVIRPSNINRQLYALESTLGQFKCDAALRRVADINPACRSEALRLFADDDTLAEVLAGGPDLVLDAIDSVGPKTGLIRAAARIGAPLISCMGAALRTDPARVRVGPFSEVRHCPLAKRLRDALKKEGIPDFLCVYSDEPVVAARRRPDGLEGEFLSRGRRRSELGSLPTLTGIFGLVMANAAIKRLCGGTV